MMGKPEQTHCGEGAEVRQELRPICTQGSHKAATEFLLYILGIRNVVLTGKYQQMAFVIATGVDQATLSEFEINDV